MEDLKKTIDFMVKYVDAIQVGVTRFIETLPILTKQQVDREASKVLHETKDHYVSKVSVKIEDYVLIVDIDKDDWLANALEKGANGFDMKRGHLASPKAKMSKEGYRYIAIPIKAKAGAHKGTDKGAFYQQKINEVLSAPKFGMRQLKSRIGGKLVESQHVFHDDPFLQGLQRVRVFDSAKEMATNKSKPWQYMMFRTMSENPLSVSQWQHPGIEEKRIMREVDRWLEANLETMMDSFISQEIYKISKDLI